MSDFYELALFFDVQPDVSPEVINLLQFMIQGRGFDFTPSVSNPIFSQRVQQIVQPSGITMTIAPAWYGFFQNGHNEYEEYLPGDFGCSFINNKLVFRQVIHEDDFWNTWTELRDWLASISQTIGFVGYFNNLENDSLEDATLIHFEDGQATDSPIEDIQLLDNIKQEINAALS